MSVTTNTKKEIQKINLIPIPEENWWKGKERKITHIPISDCKVEYFSASDNSNLWLDTSYQASDDFISWPWWKLEGREVYLFFNYPLRLFGIESLRQDEDEFLDFLLEVLGTKSELIFVSNPWSEWTEEIINDQYLCNKNNRSVISPSLSLCGTYLRNQSDEQSIKNKLINWLRKEEGTHILRWNGKEILRYDCSFEEEYGSLRSRIGIEEKKYSTSNGLDMLKKTSFIKAFIQQKRKEWINLINSSLKKS